MLILGSGPSTLKYIEDIEFFIVKHNPIVLCLNINESVPAEMVDAYIACHETRILIESSGYSKLKKPIILPLKRVPDFVDKALQGVNVLDYGLKIGNSSFEIYKNGCTLSIPLALFYAISVANAGGSKKILLAGIDGYESSDPRYIEMVDVLKMYIAKNSSLPLIAITPTTYPITQRSIFEPEL